jgi:carbamoyl-phosphate synthase large subunit
VVDLINRNEVDIVVNTPSGRSARADGYEIRAAAVAADKPLFTTIAQLGAAVASFDGIREGFDVTSLQEYAIARASRA